MNRQTSLLPDSLSGADILKMLWTNWAMGFGALMMLLLLSLFLPSVWLPLVAVTEALFLRYYRIPVCDSTEDGALTKSILSISIRSLWMCAFVMFIIELLYTPRFGGRYLQLAAYNDEIPFVTCLIVFPVLALNCILWFLFKSSRRRPGFGEPMAAIRTMIPREVAYQGRILLILSILLGGVEAWYYFSRYINSNLNAPDRFFFVVMPIAFYLLSLFFMGGRYTTLSALVEAVDSLPAGAFSTLVRYIIFSGNEILVRPNNYGLYDSPVEIVKTDNEALGEDVIRKDFSEIVPTERFTLRYLYKSLASTSNLNVMHYAAILDEDFPRTDIVPEEGDAAGDRWIGLYEVQRLAAEGKLSPVLASELVRIYAVTMAWKTYDREGRRQYPIRNYRPTFRFRDLGKWDVDYDDPHWLEIADFNEDKPFYRLRRFFRRKR